MTKPLENTSRHINIAPVNKLARSCRDLNIDLGQVIGPASTKPYRFHSFRHGPGARGQWSSAPQIRPHRAWTSMGIHTSLARKSSDRRSVSACPALTFVGSQ
jgi:hypothetical protein